MSTREGTVEVPNRANQVVILHTVLPCFVAIFIGLRLYARFFLIKAPGWDDLLLTSGWVSLLKLNMAQSANILSLASYRCERYNRVYADKLWIRKAYERCGSDFVRRILQGTPSSLLGTPANILLSSCTAFPSSTFSLISVSRTPS